MFNKVLSLIIFTVVLVALTACGQPKETALGNSDPSAVAAVINGQKITDKDLMTAVEPHLKKIEAEIYKMKEAALNQLIDEKLIAEAAAKEGKSPEQYLADYSKENIKEPTDEEIKKFYEFRKKQMGDKTYDEVKGQIVEFLKSNQENTLNRKLINSLRAKAVINIKMEPPRVDVKVGDSPTRGPKNAPVTIIEFSDFQCPFCGRARETVNKIVETYPKEVIYVFKDFPLNFHKDSPKAHEAAHCAGEQGKYWEMNKILFENQKALTVSDLNKYAKKIGVNTKKFDKCLTESKHADKVAKGLEEGRDAGVSGTPAFFVNGIMISGARPFTDFKQIIDSELSRNK